MKKYKRHASRKEAEAADRKRLRDREEAAALQEERPSRYRPARKAVGKRGEPGHVPARPAGLAAVAAFGSARAGFNPDDHITTGLHGVREGARPGEWFTEDEGGNDVPDIDFAPKPEPAEDTEPRPAQPPRKRKNR